MSDTVAPVSLDLTTAPSTLFFFGLAGVGKNYVADLVGAYAGWHVYHADIDLTNEMKVALAEKLLFTDEMRDNFFEIISCSIRELQKTHSRLVVSQAAYKQRNRDFLSSRVKNIEFVCVNADDHLILQRLRERGNSVSSEYATTIRNNFEPPSPEIKVLQNDGGDSRIIEQLNLFYKAS